MHYHYWYCNLVYMSCIFNSLAGNVFKADIRTLWLDILFVLVVVLGPPPPLIFLFGWCRPVTGWGSFTHSSTSYGQALALSLWLLSGFPPPGDVGAWSCLATQETSSYLHDDVTFWRAGARGVGGGCGGHVMHPPFRLPRCGGGGEGTEGDDFGVSSVGPPNY